MGGIYLGGLNKDKEREGAIYVMIWDREKADCYEIRAHGSVTLRIHIYGYGFDDGDPRGNKCKVSLEVKCHDWTYLYVDERELITSREIDSLIIAVKKLLRGKIYGDWNLMLFGDRFKKYQLEFRQFYSEGNEGPFTYLNLIFNDWLNFEIYEKKDILAFLEYLKRVKAGKTKPHSTGEQHVYDPVFHYTLEEKTDLESSDEIEPSGQVNGILRIENGELILNAGDGRTDYYLKIEKGNVKKLRKALGGSIKYKLEQLHDGWFMYHVLDDFCKEHYIDHDAATWTPGYEYDD